MILVGFMRRIISSFFRLSVFVVGLLVVVGWGVSTAVVNAQTNSPDRIFIIGNPDAERFPEVSVLIRAVDQNNNVVTALVDRHLKVFENEKQIAGHSVTPSERTPAYIVFVIDQGLYFSPGNRRVAIQQAMRQWVDEGHFREGFDTVAILSRQVVDGRDQTVEILPPTQSQNSFLNAVNQLTLESSEARTDGLALVDDGLTRLRQLVPQTGAASTAVVYIGSILESSGVGQDRVATDALALATKAREQNSNIHAFDSDASHRHAEPMINLTRASGGTYVELRSDRSNDANVRAVYQSVIDQAQTHIVTYRSNFDSAIDNPGARNVVVVPTNVPLNAAESVASYTIAPRPPAVRISAPTNDFVVNREPTRAADGSWSYRLSTVEVEASVDWENNVAPRNLAEAELVINGQTLPAVVPELSNNRFKLTWDLSNFEDVRETVRLQVRIRDELGLEATSTAVQLTVNAQLPEPTPTAQPTAVVVPPETTGSSSNGEIVPTSLLLLGGIGLFIIVLMVIVGFFLSQRNQSPAPALSSPASPSKRPLNVEKTMVGGQALGQKALAKVEIEVARKDLVGESVDLYTNRTSFGRDPRQCDIQLYDEDEKSSVSGLHCTIQYDVAQRKFFITDDNSSNGTYINGERLKPNLPRQLTDNTTVVLGSIGRRGAKIRFRTIAAADDKSPSFAATPGGKPVDPDKTMLDPNSTQLVDDVDNMVGSKPRTGGTTELGGDMLNDAFFVPEGEETIVELPPSTNMPAPKPNPWADEETIRGMPDDPIPNRRNVPTDEDDSWLEEL